MQNNQLGESSVTDTNPQILGDRNLDPYSALITAYYNTVPSWIEYVGTYKNQLYSMQRPRERAYAYIPINIANRSVNPGVKKRHTLNCCRIK